MTYFQGKIDVLVPGLHSLQLSLPSTCVLEEMDEFLPSFGQRDRAIVDERISKLTSSA